MGNLCSIFHSRFRNLIKVIPCARKAQLIDYILLGWQTSTYKLKGSEKKWFMKPYSEISSETGIPQSTLQRYIKELNDSGFIERRQALYSKTNENGVFEIKKGAYLYITKQLLDLLKSFESTSNKNLHNQNKYIHNDPKASTEDNPSNKDNENPLCTNFNINERIDPLKMRGLYIRDLYISSNNNIKIKQLIQSVDNPSLNRLISQYQSIEKYVSTEIKEEIPEEIKKLILGTFFNLTFEHKKHFSSPGQIVAEYLFSLINTDFCLPDVLDFKNRNNILAKIMRQNKWRTPKGFYTHFYLGQNFKDKKQLHEQQWQKAKECEINPIKSPDSKVINEKLTQIEQQIYEKGALIRELTHSIYQQTNKERISSNQENINKLRNELEYLWGQQSIFEGELERENNFKGIKRCA